MRDVVHGTAGFRGATAGMWLIILILATTVLASYRVLHVGGVGMSPTVYEGDRLLYHRHVETRKLQRKGLIVFRLHRDNKFAEPGTYVIARIMALPGDKLSLRGDLYYVNDRPAEHAAPRGPYPVALNIPKYPQTITVPPDCYFVYQDSPERGLDSRVLSWAHYDDIVGTKVFRLSGLPPFKPIE
jgi:signal peptidase I